MSFASNPTDIVVALSLGRLDSILADACVGHGGQQTRVRTFQCAVCGAIVIQQSCYVRVLICACNPEAVADVARSLLYGEFRIIV